MRQNISNMTDSGAKQGESSSDSISTSQTTAPATTSFDPADLCAALGNPLRWQMVAMLASGAALSASEVATQLGRDFDGVSKHLRLLRTAGVLASRRGEDRRSELYFLPEAFRAKPGELDFGNCWFQLPSSQNK